MTPVGFEPTTHHNHFTQYIQRYYVIVLVWSKQLSQQKQSTRRDDEQKERMQYCVIVTDIL